MNRHHRLVAFSLAAAVAVASVVAALSAVAVTTAPLVWGADDHGQLGRNGEPGEVGA